MKEAEVLEILKREIILTCHRENPDDCECVWKVKPGNLEHCAKLIATASGDAPP